MDRDDTDDDADFDIFDNRKTTFENNRPSTVGSLGSIEELLGKGPILRNGKTKASVGWRFLFAFTTKKHVVLLFLASLTGILSGAIGPITTIFIGRVFQAFTDFGSNSVEASTLQNEVKMNSLILAALGTADWLFTAIFIFLWVIFGELQAKRARVSIFNGLFEKSSAFYDTLPHGIAAMTPRIQTHVRELQIATSQVLGATFSALTGAIASFVIAMKYEWSLALILLSTQPINAIVLGFMSSRMRKHVQTQVDKLAVAAKRAANAFSAIETVKIFCAEDSEIIKFASSIKQAACSYNLVVRGNAVQIGYVRCMTLLTFMAGFWYGSHLVISGKRTTGDVVTTFFSCLEVTSAVQGVLPQMIILEKGRVSGAILKVIAGEVRARSNLGADKRILDFKGEITMQDVTFAYPSRPAHDVLKGVTCNFPAGRTTFIIGRSGSGKSSFAQLLLRFYEPGSGQIQLDGYALEDLDLHWLRSNITLVEQESVLFDGSIFENIALGVTGKGTVALNDVKAAAEFALLSNTTVEFPNGFDSEVGQKGHLLSGGQRQRVAIARARIRNAPVLILDESTSALDHVSRSLIVSAVREWRREKTTIFITHDLSLIESHDSVCIFDDGHLVECSANSDFSSESNLKLESLFNISKPSGSEERTLQKTSWCSKDDKDYHESILKFTEREKSKVTISQLAETLGDSMRSELPLSSPSPSGASNLCRPLKTPLPISARSFSLSRVSLSPTRSLSKSSLSSDLEDIESKHLIRGRSGSDTLELDMLERTGELAMQRRINTRHSRLGRDRVLPKCNRTIARHSKVDGHDIDRKDYDFSHSPKVLSLPQILRSVWPRIRKRARSILVVAFLCALIHAISIPIFSWLFSRLISTFYERYSAQQKALTWSLCMLALSLLDGCACYGMHVAFEYSAQAWVDSVRLEAMKRVIKQPKEFFEDTKNTSSQLSYSLDRNAEEMRNIVGRFVAFISVAFVLMGMVIIWCLLISWKLTLVGLTLTPVSWGVARMYQVISERLEGRSNDAGEIASAILDEAFTNIKTVRALTLETSFRRKHTSAAKRAMNVGIRRAFYSGIFYGVSEAIMVFNNCLIFVYGAQLVSTATVSVADVLLVFSQLMFALGNVTNIVNIIPQVSSSKDTATRLLFLANLPESSHERRGNIRPTTVTEIELTGLTFSYTGSVENAVLRNVNLKIFRGTTTALVGASGSGKSTIASLLLKLYPVAERGEEQPPMITIGGRDLHRIHTATLRSLICVVPQTPVLLPGSVAENIAYGQEWSGTPTQIESIRVAAKGAGIDDFLLSLPSGYDTVIGDGGLGLSGGQTQRVAIARALFRNPTVLVLDEATSALDRDSAAMVYDTVRRLIRGNPQMTVIIITHSKELMLLADRIVVLDQGRVVDEGSFSELSTRSGPFANLQSGGIWTSDYQED